LNDKKVQNHLLKWTEAINIETGPLFACGYLYGFSDGSSCVWFAFHHLIADSNSFKLVSDDLARFYKNLPFWVKGLWYKEWCWFLKAYGIKKTGTNEEFYWRALLPGIRRFNKYLSRLGGGGGDGFLNKKIDYELELCKSDSLTLLKDAPNVFNSNLNAIFLTAIGHGLKEITKNPVNYVTLNCATRKEVFVDHTNARGLDIILTVGLFRICYPVKIHSGNKNADVLASLKENTSYIRDIPNNGLGYGPLVGYLKLPRVRFDFTGIKNESNNYQKDEWHLIETTNEFEEDYVYDNDIAIRCVCSNSKLFFKFRSRLSQVRTLEFIQTIKCRLEELAQKTRTSPPMHDLTLVDYGIRSYDSPFTIFNEIENKGKILFFLPPIGGHAESYYNNLVPRLLSYKLVLFNNYYNNMRAKCLDTSSSISHLAHFYVTLVRQLQPTGPYSFIGQSFGGLVAFEMTRQLCNKGARVENVFFIDTLFNINKTLHDIDRGYELNTLDKITYKYVPVIDGSEMFKTKLKDINWVLFKAERIDEYFKLDVTSYEWYKYYVKSEFNNLESFLSDDADEQVKLIRRIVLENHSHLSWRWDQQEIEKMANHIKNYVG
jgi:N-(5-amino-5-carboxypentanoyl)-L-cysteinyl-D-valine synthase